MGGAPVRIPRAVGPVEGSGVIVHSRFFRMTQPHTVAIPALLLPDGLVEVVDATVPNPFSRTIPVHIMVIPELHLLVGPAVVVDVIVPNQH